MIKIKVPQRNLEFVADSTATLMSNLLKQNIPVASSCQGDGVCGLCYVLITKGADKLEAPSDSEKALLLKKKYQDLCNKGQSPRLSCCFSPQSSVTLETLYW